MSSALRSLELYGELCPEMTWRAECTALSRLRRIALRQTTFTPTVSTARYAHPVSLAPSPDGALLAVVGSDGRVEIHEPAALESSEISLRLTLVPRPDGLKVAAAQWGTKGDADNVFLALANKPQVFSYALDTCELHKPSRTYTFPRPGKSSLSNGGATDIAVVGEHCFAAAQQDGPVFLFDRRLRSMSSPSSVAGSIEVTTRNNVIAHTNSFLYVADMGLISMYDLRMLTSATGAPVAPAQQAKVMRSSKSRPSITQLARARVHNSHFNFIAPLPNAPLSCITYQLFSGAVGYLDITVPFRGGIHVPEAPSQKSILPESGLADYGQLQRDQMYPWYVARRRGCVTSGPFGRGWRVIVPRVTEPGGLRVVRFGPSVQTNSFDIDAGGHTTCVHAIDGSLRKLVVGYAVNSISMLEEQWPKQEPCPKVGKSRTQPE